MKINLSILVMLLCMSGFVHSQDSTLALTGDNYELFKKGNEAFVADDFEASITYYGQVLASGFESAEVYFNTGNAYFKAGDLPNAILYFERAKKLDPDNEDILANLEIANLKTVDKVESKPEIPLTSWWTGFLNQNLIDEWAVKSIYIAFIGLGFMLIFLFTSSWLKRISFFTGLFVFLISFLFFFFGQIQKSRHLESKYGIVFAPSVTVKSSPEQDGTRLFVIHEGTKIEVMDEQDNWTEISLMNGNKGWIPTEAFKNI